MAVALLRRGGPRDASFSRRGWTPSSPAPGCPAGCVRWPASSPTAGRPAICTLRGPGWPTAEPVPRCPAGCVRWPVTPAIGTVCEPPGSALSPAAMRTAPRFALSGYGAGGPV